MADNEEKLVKMLKYVSEHNDFYKNRIKEYGISNPLDITQWPVLTRKELQENRYNMFSDGYKSKYYNQQLKRQSSSGSSGMPVNVYWDYKDWYASNLCLWRKRQEWYGIGPLNKQIKFTSAFVSCTDGLKYHKEGSNVYVFDRCSIKNDIELSAFWELLNDISPDWIYVQPSMLLRLSKYAIDCQPSFQMKYIESVGEVLHRNVSYLARKSLNCQVTNMYGSEEMNGIAIEKSDGKMLVLDDNVFVEVNENEQLSSFGTGESIITNLNNHAMPLIRYSQGDIIHLSKNEIHEIKGRINDSFKLHQKIVYAADLNSIVFDVNNIFFESIKQFQFTYSKSKNNLTCNVLIEKQFLAWFDAICKTLKYKLILLVENKCEINILLNNKEFIEENKTRILRVVE